MSPRGPASPIESRSRWAGVTIAGARRRGMLIAVDPSAARAALKRTGVPVLRLVARGRARLPAARGCVVTGCGGGLAG
ncbi:type II secretion system F family protein, partial [Burkholderia pseudomallei]